jgi:hypothetical protein
VQEETVVERETRVIESERLALVWGGRDDDLSDAQVFEVGACTRIREVGFVKKHLQAHLLFAR